LLTAARQICEHDIFRMLVQLPPAAYLVERAQAARAKSGARVDMANARAR